MYKTIDERIRKALRHVAGGGYLNAFLDPDTITEPAKCGVLTVR